MLEYRICSNGIKRLIGMDKPLQFSRKIIFIKLDKGKYSGEASVTWNAQLNISVPIESLN